jgi:serine/threonine protein kinase
MNLRLTQQSEPLPGYRLVERLGRGGYGEVWKAEAPGGLFKAIKFVYGDLDRAGDDNRGAEQELKALNRIKSIRHPFILSIERFDIIEGQLLIVMELADRNLWDRFQECRDKGLPGIPREELLGYMDEAAEALDLMNNVYQLQHLDIKPQNLFLVHNHVKVADFGLAKDFEGMRATMTGGVTPVYAAPETFEGWVSRNSDQYSLAIVYQELLTGVRPFSGTNARQLTMQHITADPDVSALPIAERDAIARALSKKPDKRFASCAELVAALRAGSEDVDAPASTGAAVAAGPTLPNCKGPTQPNGPPPEIAKPPASPTARNLPKLVTPRTASGDSRYAPRSRLVSPTVTAQRPLATDTCDRARLGIVAPEKRGSGVLVPIYVVGVGGIGQLFLRRLRACLHDRLGKSSFPHWRWLYIDTDEQAVAAATMATATDGLAPEEVVLARMHRAGHYLKRDGMPPTDSWMGNDTLYRIPREPATGGIRSLGRLALCDHYPAIIQRIRDDLRTFLSDDGLHEADRRTKLGIRSNRPRVYVAASLSGGTGSGMLIDLAYLIRRELKQVGIADPTLTGLLFVPAAKGGALKPLALANAAAMLSELGYFSQPQPRYEARFDTREPPLVFQEAPFERCVALGLPAPPADATAAANRAASLIYLESFSLVGRCLDEQPAAGQWGPRICTVGSYSLAWPRQLLLETAAARCAGRMLRQWCARDSNQLRREVATWIEEQWRQRDLGPTHLAHRVEQAMIVEWKSDPLAVVEVELATPAGRSERNATAAAVDRVFQLLGKSGREELLAPGQLTSALEAAVRRVTREASVEFARLAVHFIEVPRFRLAGAEETVRICAEHIKTFLDENERELQKLDQALADDLAQMFPSLGPASQAGLSKSVTRRAPATAEFLDRLRSWTQKRYRQLVIRGVGGVYRKMVSNAPQYLRDVDSCRNFLGRLADDFESRATSTAQRDPENLILPAGTGTLSEAVNRLLERIPPAAFNEFEEGTQRQVKRRCRALARACLTSELAPTFKEILESQARDFVHARLENLSVADEFFRANREPETAIAVVRRAWKESTPESFGKSPDESGQKAIVGAGAGEAGQRLRSLAVELSPNPAPVEVTTGSEIIFAQQRHDLTIADLPPAGSVGIAAMQQVIDSERIDPHCRTDVLWPPIGSV